MQLILISIVYILITIVCYLISNKISKKCNNAIINPVLLSIIMILAILILSKNNYTDYSQGGNFITLLLGPATTVLALPIYRQRALLKKHFLAIIVGTGIGSIASISCITVLGKLLGITTAQLSSLVPKSITTPIAIAVSANMGGIPAITVTAVIITGILGSVIAPSLIKVFKIKHPVAQGVGIGSCSHAIGTSKAIELGEDIGAMSGISIAFSGLFTVFWTLLFF